jgi:hypothetical protein
MYNRGDIIVVGDRDIIALTYYSPFLMQSTERSCLLCVHRNAKAQKAHLFFALSTELRILHIIYFVGWCQGVDRQHGPNKDCYGNRSPLIQSVSICCTLS